eukprot:3625928-Rhodomonas_salina.3
MELDADAAGAVAGRSAEDGGDGVTRAEAEDSRIKELYCLVFSVSSRCFAVHRVAIRCRERDRGGSGGKEARGRKQKGELVQNDGGVHMRLLNETARHRAGTLPVTVVSVSSVGQPARA